LEAGGVFYALRMGKKLKTDPSELGWLLVEVGLQ
jgi:hypothetical protein